MKRKLSISIVKVKNNERNQMKLNFGETEEQIYNFKIKTNLTTQSKN